MIVPPSSPNNSLSVFHSYVNLPCLLSQIVPTFSIFFSSSSLSVLFGFPLSVSHSSTLFLRLSSSIYKQEEREATLPCLVKVQGRVAWGGFCTATPAAAGYSVPSPFFIMIAGECEYGLCRVFLGKTGQREREIVALQGNIIPSSSPVFSRPGEEEDLWCRLKCYCLLLFLFFEKYHFSKTCRFI